MKRFVGSLLLSLVSVCLLEAQDAPGKFRWPEGKRVAVSLTFDDARASQMDVGAPLFDRYRARVTFYINPPNMGPRLEAWRKAASGGRYEIANHSESHPCSGNFPWSRNNALEEYTEARMEKEMLTANADTERLLGVKPAAFAYPCGQKFVGAGLETKSYVPLVAKHFLTGRGFRDEAANDPMFCDFAQLFGVQSDGLSFEDLRKLVEDAAKTGGWLILAGHEIGNAGEQTTQVSALEQFLKYAQDPVNGIWLDTVTAVATYVQGQRDRQKH